MGHGEMCFKAILFPIGSWNAVPVLRAFRCSRLVANGSRHRRRYRYIV